MLPQLLNLYRVCVKQKYDRQLPRKLAKGKKTIKIVGQLRRTPLDLSIMFLLFLHCFTSVGVFSGSFLSIPSKELSK